MLTFYVDDLISPFRVQFQSNPLFIFLSGDEDRDSYRFVYRKGNDIQLSETRIRNGSVGHEKDEMEEL